MKIKTGDTVKVISGHYKGTVAEVKAVNPKTNKVIVEGVNVVKKTLKPTQQNPEGGVVEKEAKAASRVSIKVDDKGKKVRVYKKSGAEVKGGKK